MYTCCCFSRFVIVFVGLGAQRISGIALIVCRSRTFVACDDTLRLPMAVGHLHRRLVRSSASYNKRILREGRPVQVQRSLRDEHLMAAMRTRIVGQ